MKTPSLKKIMSAGLCAAALLCLSACGGKGVEAPSPAPVETASPTATPTASPEATATPTPTPSPTVEPSPEPTPEATAEPTPTAKATPAPTPKASKTPATAAPTPEPTQNAAAETDRPDGWIDENPRTPPPELLEELERQNSQSGTSGNSDFDVEASNRRMEEQAGKVSVENAPVSDMTREEAIAAGRHIIE